MHVLWDRGAFRVVQKPELLYPSHLKYQPLQYLTLKEAIGKARRPSLRIQVELAWILTHSLLLLDGSSPWSASSTWEKVHLTFFLTPHGEPDFERPYLSTYFDEPVSQLGDPTTVSEAHHQSASNGILKLAILLMEIKLWKKIENLRQDFDCVPYGSIDWEFNSDINVALRKLEEYSSRLTPGTVEDSYFNSVSSCIHLDWDASESWNGFEILMPQGISIFRDANNCDRYYQAVVRPLQELAALGLAQQGAQ